MLVGPFVPHPRVAGSKRAKLFVLVDDYSRLLVHGRWMTEENTRAGQDVLRSAIARRGLPQILHVDNGAPYANHQLARACAVLGIHLVHSKPYSPQGRGKQERLNSYIRQSFIAEMEDRGIADFDALNDFFMAWAEQVANARTHAETKRPPIERFLANHTPTIPTPARAGRSVPVVDGPSGHQDGDDQPCWPTATRSTRRSSGAPSSCASTPRTSPASTCSTTASAPARPSRS